MSSPIVVFVEHLDGQPRRASLECAGAASATGRPVFGVVQGDLAVAQSLGQYGFDKVAHLPETDKQSPDGLAADIAAVCKEQSAGAFLCAASATGKDIAPRVAAALDSTLFSDCTDIKLDGDAFVATRPWLAGKAIATLRSNAPVFCATTRPNVFSANETGGSAEIIDANSTTDLKALITSIEEKVGGTLDVKEAPVVISGGRGLKAPEGFGMLDDLAKAFGNAAVGASRAVVDLGWRPHSEQVGQTGKTVQPQLYFAVGISGAIQHLAGMRTSQVIVAVNKDPEAPIFKVADYGIVGDAFEIVPKITEAVRELKAQA